MFKTIGRKKEYDALTDYLNNLICENGEAFLSVSQNVDLVFLDIEMPIMDGLDTKEKLYAMERHPIIVFLTSHQELMQQAFGISVLGFLLKPINPIYFFQIFEKALTLCSMHCKIQVGNKDNPIYISSRKVLYIESDKVYSNVVTKEGTYLLRKSLNLWEEELNKYGFYRLHKSYLVNMENIMIVGKSVLMVNKEELKISRSIKKQFIDSYNQYCRRMAKYI